MRVLRTEYDTMIALFSDPTAHVEKCLYDTMIALFSDPTVHVEVSVVTCFRRAYIFS